MDRGILIFLDGEVLEHIGDFYFNHNNKFFNQLSEIPKPLIEFGLQIICPEISFEEINIFFFLSLKHSETKKKTIGEKKLGNLTPNSTLSNLFLLTEHPTKIIIYNNLPNDNILNHLVGIDFDGNLFAVRK